MAILDYTPDKISTPEAMASKTVMTAEHWNNAINMLIAQGNETAQAVYDLIIALAAKTAGANIGVLNQAAQDSTLQAQLNVLFQVAQGAGNMPAGGLTNQVLQKKSATDFDAIWSVLMTNSIAATTALKTAFGLADTATADDVFTAIKTNLDGIKTIIATVAPTTSTVGTVGQFYLNTTTSILYQCVNINGSVYTWQAFDLSSLSGILPISKGGTGAISAAAALTALGGSKVVTGSYTGTGMCGPGNSNSLTFDFVPKIVMISSKYSDGAAILMNLVSVNILHDNDSYFTTTWNGRTVSWYHGGSAGSQLNTSNNTYYYTTIG